MFYRHLPLALFILPLCSNDTGVELEITIEIPLFDRAFHVIKNVASAGVESRPVGIRIKREGLRGVVRYVSLNGERRGESTHVDMSRHIALNTRVVVR